MAGSKLGNHPLRGRLQLAPTGGWERPSVAGAGVLINAVWGLVRGHLDAFAAALISDIGFTTIIKLIALAAAYLAVATMVLYKTYEQAIELSDAIPAWLGTNFRSYNARVSETSVTDQAHRMVGGIDSGINAGLNQQARINAAKQSGIDKVPGTKTTGGANDPN